MICPTCHNHMNPTMTQNELRIMVKLKKWLDSDPSQTERFKKLVKLDDLIEKESA